jgi:hypothetical protein
MLDCMITSNILILYSTKYKYLDSMLHAKFYSGKYVALKLGASYHLMYVLQCMYYNVMLFGPIM